MQKGFKKVASSLVREKPGLTAMEYAKLALDRGLCSSDSKNPVFSLGTTLMKEVREGRMPGIKLYKINGRLHYFPDNYVADSQSALPRGDRGVTILLPPDVAETVDTLIEVGTSKTENEVLVWLIREGMKAKGPELDHAKTVTQAIKQLKQSVSI